MRIEGTLHKWNDDRGFGFIAPTDGGPEVFVHVSAFPSDNRRPAIGERVNFEIDIAPDGKTRAVRVRCPNRPPPKPARPATRTSEPAARRAPRHKPSLLSRMLPAVVMTALVVAYFQYSERNTGAWQPAESPPAEQPWEREPATAVVDTTAFQCDGRTHCSEMRSCAEATYFLRNCPGVKMDGNNDGIPCEQQWCN